MSWSRLTGSISVVPAGCGIKVCFRAAHALHRGGAAAVACGGLVVYHEGVTCLGAHDEWFRCATTVGIEGLADDLVAFEVDCEDCGRNHLCRLCFAGAPVRERTSFPALAEDPDARQLGAGRSTRSSDADVGTKSGLAPAPVVWHGLPSPEVGVRWRTHPFRNCRHSPSSGPMRTRCPSRPVHQHDLASSWEVRGRWQITADPVRRRSTGVPQRFHRIVSLRVVGCHLMAPIVVRPPMPTKAPIRRSTAIWRTVRTLSRLMSQRAGTSFATKGPSVQIRSPPPRKPPSGTS